jgi:ribosomal protein S2
MKNEIIAYRETLKKLKEIRKNVLILEAGMEVILANGTKQIISKVVGDEAWGENAFYRWDRFFPYEIEHAAMYGSNLEIVDVKHN